MPPASAPKPISTGEQSMPFDGSPRILRRPIFMPFGIVVPTVASGTRSPTCMLKAPHHTWSGSPSPVSTSTRCTWFGVGMRPQREHLRDDHAVDRLADPHRRRRPRGRGRSSAPRARRHRRRRARARSARSRTHAASELLQEPDVVGEHLAEVVDAVTRERQPVGAEAEREAAPLLGVDDRSCAARWDGPCRTRRARATSRRVAGCRTRPTAR